MTRTAVVSFLALAAFFGCGTDVSLGVTPDAAAADLPLDCQKCSAQPDCNSNEVCGAIAGDSYCATVCPNGTGCESDETCDNITTVGGAPVYACVPNGGLCTSQAERIDGGTSDH